MALWAIFIVSGLGLHAITLPLGEDARSISALIIGLAAVAAYMRLVRRAEPGRRLPWALLGAGAGSVISGLVVQGVHRSIAGEPELFPTFGEPLISLGYLCVFAGILSLIRLRTVERSRDDVVDALIVATAVGLWAWIVVLWPHLADDSVRLVERLMNVQFSLLALLVVGAVTRLAVGPGFRTPAYYLFAAGITALFVSDAIYTVESTRNVSTSLYDVIAPLSYVFTGAAALHPSVGRLTDPPEYMPPRLTWRRMAMLGAALLMGPAVLVFQSVRDAPINVPVVVIGWVALSVLVLVRLARLIKQEERAATRERVLRDMGSVLVVGGTQEEMYTAALWAVLELTEGLPHGRATVLSIDESGVAEVVSSVGDRAELSAGFRIPVAELPEEVQEALTQRHTISLEQVPVFDVDRASGGLEATLVVAPLVARGRTTGAIIVASAVPIERGVISALTAVAREVSLAIESAALTEDLHRRKSDRRFRALVENSSELIVVLDDDNQGVFASPATEWVLGRSDHEFLGVMEEELVHPDDVEKLLALFAAARKDPGPGDDEPIEVRLLHADSSYRWFEMRARDLRDNPEVAGLAVTARDITDRTLAEQRLARSEARFRSLVQNSSDIVAVIDEHGSLTYVSPAVTPMLGFRAEELVGTNIMRLLPADEVSRAMRLLEGIREESFDQMHLEMRLRDRGGTWRHVDVTISDMRSESAVQGIVLNVRDITVKRALEEDLLHKALHDELTGLGNRVHIEKRLTRALGREGPRLDQVAVMLIDLDDFKEINDSLGHSVGDQLLMSVAERIRACLRVSDAAARQGGDEFVVLLEDIYGDAEAFAVAERILLAISQPYHLDGRELSITASIGIVIDKDRSSTPDGLMRAADVAMYLAKDRGKNRYELFHEAAHARAFERLEMKAALAEAVRSGTLQLHYQPIVDLATGTIAGCEALVRWNHPERGLVPPADFIPLAEDSGLIVALGRWVLNEACRQLGEWTRAVPAAGDLRVSVNLSVRQIESITLVSDVTDAIVAGGIEPHHLTLEITESLVMNDDPDTINRLSHLRDLGIRLAVDDFGTGYSSLGYIQQFPLDIIKIDRSFVSRLDTPSAGSRQLVRTIVELAGGLNAATVAEGIETEAERQELVLMGCDYGQGFYFARPMPADRFLALLTGAATPASTAAGFKIGPPTEG